MIAEKEILRAIRECETEPLNNHKISTLADFYIVYDHLFGIQPDFPEYSHENQIENTIDGKNCDTEFLKLVNGKSTEKVLHKMDELMQVTQVLHPRMYERILRELAEI